MEEVRVPGGDPGRSEGGEVTHGFLFADLRGYTALVETRGAIERPW